MDGGMSARMDARTDTGISKSLYVLHSLFFLPCLSASLSVRSLSCCSVRLVGLPLGVELAEVTV